MVRDKTRVSKWSESGLCFVMWGGGKDATLLVGRGCWVGGGGGVLDKAGVGTVPVGDRLMHSCVQSGQKIHQRH